MSSWYKFWNFVYKRSPFIAIAVQLPTCMHIDQLRRQRVATVILKWPNRQKKLENPWCSPIFPRRVRLCDSGKTRQTSWLLRYRQKSNARAHTCSFRSPPFFQTQLGNAASVIWRIHTLNFYCNAKFNNNKFLCSMQIHVWVCVCGG